MPMDNVKKYLIDNVARISCVTEVDQSTYQCDTFVLVQGGDEDDADFTYWLNGKEIAWSIGNELWGFIEDILEEVRQEACNESNSLKWLDTVYEKMKK